jgi:hypothetical protein
MLGRLLGALIIATLVLLLWLMPALFPHPGPNDALELSSLGPLLYLIAIGASLVSPVGVFAKGWKAEVLVGLGVFLIGVSGAFVLAIVAFGNFSDDRFLPLFVAPVLAAPVGIVITVVGWTITLRRRGRPLLGAAIGAAVAVVVVLWLLARGARDWLLAPYGFDVFGLISVGAVTVTFASAYLPFVSRPRNDGS